MLNVRINITSLRYILFRRLFMASAVVATKIR